MGPAQTQGAFLTILRGIGIVLAAGAIAETGDPTEQKPVANLISYSGIIPRIVERRTCMATTIY